MEIRFPTSIQIFHDSKIDENKSDDDGGNESFSISPILQLQLFIGSGTVLKNPKSIVSYFTKLKKTNSNVVKVVIFSCIVVLRRRRIERRIAYLTVSNKHLVTTLQQYLFASICYYICSP